MSNKSEDKLLIFVKLEGIAERCFKNGSSGPPSES